METKQIETIKDKKVPTHGPGTFATYRGQDCKILSIKNGKAKIFINGKALIVNYTSIVPKNSETFPTYDITTNVENLDLFFPIIVNSLLTPELTLYQSIVNSNGSIPAELEPIVICQRNFIAFNSNGDTGEIRKIFEAVDQKLQSTFSKNISFTSANGTVFEVFSKDFQIIVKELNQTCSRLFFPKNGKLFESSRKLFTEEYFKNYEEFFRTKMEKYGIKSPNELSDEDKKKFFNEIKKEWDEYQNK